jgi:hypothetical protein
MDGRGMAAPVFIKVLEVRRNFWYNLRRSENTKSLILKGQ